MIKEMGQILEVGEEERLNEVKYVGRKIMTESDYVHHK